jgi:hypothetical protein
MRAPILPHALRLLYLIFALCVKEIAPSNRLFFFHFILPFARLTFLSASRPHGLQWIPSSALSGVTIRPQVLQVIFISSLQ